MNNFLSARYFHKSPQVCSDYFRTYRYSYNHGIFLKILKDWPIYNEVNTCISIIHTKYILGIIYIQINSILLKCLRYIWGISILAWVHLGYIYFCLGTFGVYLFSLGYIWGISIFTGVHLGYKFTLVEMLEVHLRYIYLCLGTFGVYLFSLGYI